MQVIHEGFLTQSSVLSLSLQYIYRSHYHAIADIHALLKYKDAVRYADLTACIFNYAVALGTPSMILDLYLDLLKYQSRLSQISYSAKWRGLIILSN